MSVGYYVAVGAPVVVKEEVKVVRLFVEYFAGEQVEHVPQLPLQPFVLPHAVEVGVRLENVQMGVHRLARVLVLVAKAHVLNGFPLARKGLDVAIPVAVEAVFFNRFKQFYSVVESLAVASGSRVFAQSIDGEALRVDLFLRVERLAVGRKRPVHASEVIIIKLVYDVTLGARGRLQVFGLAQQAVSRRESPQYAGVENSPLGRVGVQFVVAVYASVEAALHVVCHLFHPERQYAGRQFMLHFRAERGYLIVHLFACV